ncbi:MAG TPA: anti-sigma factor [Stellaceae bacterium]|jgi:anti-sigma factor RsiW|nr:anti-sigma factor [Stellaceae bacterium]
MTTPIMPIGEDDLQAHVDGRLDPVRLAAVESYLADHPEVAARVELERKQREMLRTQLAQKFAEPIPPRLRIASLRAARHAGGRRWLLRIAAGVALFVIGVGAGQFLHIPLKPATMADMSVANEAMIAYRTYVVEVAHPVEVGAQNEQHLVRWLSKRLGRQLVAPKLAAFGYHLMGGRLLPGMDGGVAAQLMYEDAAGKRLTIYICSGDDGQTAFQFDRDGSVSTFSWLDQGFGFAVSAALDHDRLLQVAQSVYQNLDVAEPALASGKGG